MATSSPRSSTGIGNRLSAARRASRLTQEELANRAGVAQSLVSKLESSEQADPALSSIMSLSQALGLEVSTLLTAGRREFLLAVADLVPEDDEDLAARQAALHKTRPRRNIISNEQIRQAIVWDAETNGDWAQDLPEGLGLTRSKAQNITLRFGLRGEFETPWSQGAHG